jgi:hypothetical protein
LLNSESHHSKPNSFVTEDAGVNMLYFSIADDNAGHKKPTQSFQSMVRVDMKIN